MSKRDEFRDEFFVACWKGRIDCVRDILKNGMDVNCQNGFGAHALLCSSSQGHKEIVEMLINMKANTELKTKYGATPLIAACETGHTEIAEILIKSGANINACDIGGRNALETASLRGKKEVVELLKKYGSEEISEDKKLEIKILAAYFYDSKQFKNEDHLREFYKEMDWI